MTWARRCGSRWPASASAPRSASCSIWIAAIIAFFPVYVNALTGIVTVDEDAREMFRSLGASRWQAFKHLMVPGSLPVMFAGLKTAAGLSLVGAVVGEFISA